MTLLRNRRHRYLVDPLRTAFLFAECTDSELRLVASMGTTIEVSSGRVLIREGEPGLECFVVLDGHAVVERGHQIIGHAMTGSVVGELALMRPGERRNATVTAATDMKLFVMSRSEFGGLRALGIVSIERQLELAVAQHAFAEQMESLCTPLADAAPAASVSTG